MSLLAENQAFLQEYDPDLLKWLAAHPSPAATVEQGKKGLITAVVGGKYVHSRYDPLREARSSINHPPAYLHLHFGLGLGYFLSADQTLDQGKILVFEPDPSLIRACMEHLDLRELLSQKKAMLCCSWPRFKRLLANHLRSDLDCPVVTSPYHLRSYPEVYQRFLDSIAEARYNSSLALLTIRKSMAPICKSSLSALPFTTRLPGIQALHNRFLGVPAVIVSPGPSLDRNLAQLFPYRHNCLIFALARSASPLEKAGIEPHFLVHNEYQPYFFALSSCTNLSKTAFVLGEQAETPFFKHPHGPTFVFQNPTNPVGRWLNEHFPHLTKGDIETGGSAANEAFYTACLAGCDPIILIGQDLAIRGARFYAKADANLPFEHGEQAVRWLPGYFGGKVKSFNNYLAFLFWFRDFADHFRQSHPQRRFINATEGGAHIAGFQQMTFRHAAAQFFIQAITPEPLIQTAALLSPEKTLSTPEFKRFLKVSRNRLQELKHLCLRFPDFQVELNSLLQHFSPEQSHKLKTGMKRLDQFNQDYIQKIDGLGALSGFLQETLQDLQHNHPQKSALKADAMQDLLDEIRQDLEISQKTFCATLEAINTMDSVLEHLLTQLLVEPAQ